MYIFPYFSRSPLAIANARWSGAGQLEKYASVPVIPQQRLGSSDLTSSSARRCFDASTSKMPPQQSHGLLDRFDELLDFGAHGVGISWRRRDSRDGELTPQASRRGWRSKLTRRAKLDRGGGAWPKPPRRTVVTSEKQPETSPHAAFGLASCRGRDTAVKFDPAGQRSARHRLPI